MPNPVLIWFAKFSLKVQVMLHPFNNLFSSLDTFSYLFLKTLVMQLILANSYFNSICIV